MAETTNRVKCIRLETTSVYRKWDGSVCDWAMRAIRAARGSNEHCRASRCPNCLPLTTSGLLAKWQIAGAALGIARHGRPDLSRGYGVSSSVTAPEILRLVEQGKLHPPRLKPVLDVSILTRYRLRLLIHRLQRTIQGWPVLAGNVHARSSRPYTIDEEYRLKELLSSRADGCAARMA